MKLSTRATYGVRAMMALAQYQGPGPLMSRDIAEQQSLPATYLEQLMVQLRKAGLLNATRGAHGGYQLARPAAEITMAEIIEVLEGPLTLTDCPTLSGCNTVPDLCALYDIWHDAEEALMNVFRGISLADLVERQRAKASGDALTYSI